MADQSVKEGPNKWLVALGLLFIFLVVRCANEETMTDPNSDIAPTTLMNADDLGPIALEATPDEAAVERASGHAGRVIGAMGVEGAEFYSERCEEALSKDFSVERRDRCHAFDMFAARMLLETEGYVPARFTEGALANRWSASDGSGMDPSASADRLEALETLVGTTQVRAIAAPVPSLEAPATPTNEEYEGLDYEGTDEDSFGEGVDEYG